MRRGHLQVLRREHRLLEHLDALEQRERVLRTTEFAPGLRQVVEHPRRRRIFTPAHVGERSVELDLRPLVVTLPISKRTQVHSCGDRPPMLRSVGGAKDLVRLLEALASQRDPADVQRGRAHVHRQAADRRMPGSELGSSLVSQSQRELESVLVPPQLVVEVRDARTKPTSQDRLRLSRVLEGLEGFAASFERALELAGVLQQRALHSGELRIEGRRWTHALPRRTRMSHPRPTSFGVRVMARPNRCTDGSAKRELADVRAHGEGVRFGVPLQRPGIAELGRGSGREGERLAAQGIETATMSLGRDLERHHNGIGVGPSGRSGLGPGQAKPPRLRPRWQLPRRLERTRSRRGKLLHLAQRLLDQAVASDFDPFEQGIRDIERSRSAGDVPIELALTFTRTCRRADGPLGLHPATSVGLQSLANVASMSWSPCGPGLVEPRPESRLTGRIPHALVRRDRASTITRSRGTMRRRLRCEAQPHQAEQTRTRQREPRRTRREGPRPSLQQRFHGLEAVLGSGRHRSPKYLSEPRRDAPRARGVDRARDDRIVQLEQTPPSKRRHPGENFPRGHPERELVAACVRSHSHLLLGCHVARGSRNGSRPRQDVGTFVDRRRFPVRRALARRRLTRIGRERVIQPSQPEIGELDSSVSPDQDVGRLDIAMHQAHRVRRRQRPPHRLEVSHCGFLPSSRTRGMLLTPRRQGRSLDQLHGDPRAPGLLPQPEHLHDSRMLVSSERPSFLPQSRLLLRTRRVAQHLEGDIASEFGITRPIDHAHRSLPQLLAHLVAAATHRVRRETECRQDTAHPHASLDVVGRGLDRESLQLEMDPPPGRLRGHENPLNIPHTATPAVCLAP